MEYKVSFSTDKGTVKEVNQDSVMVKVANTKDHGRILLGVLCDGMGGLSYGEVASAKAVSMFEKWFASSLPRVLSPSNVTERLDGQSFGKPDLIQEIRREWLFLAKDINEELINFGAQNSMRLGSTVVSLLVLDNEFIIMNVGDSRVYSFEEGDGRQLTHDQSVVQSLIDKGVMTRAEAENSDQKSVLLQCLGASGSVSPQIVTGKIEDPTSFLLCCDGFWRKLSEDELKEQMKPSICTDEGAMKAKLDAFIEKVKARGETDNITAVLIECQ